MCFIFFLYKLLKRSLLFVQIYQNFVKMEHHAQSVDDALIGGLGYKLKAGASYVTNRRSVSFFASGGNQYSPDGVKVCRFNLTSDHWMDPSTFRVMFQLNNKDYTSDGVTWVEPLSWNPAVSSVLPVLLPVAKLLKTLMISIAYHSC